MADWPSVACPSPACCHPDHQRRQHHLLRRPCFFDTGSEGSSAATRQQDLGHRRRPARGNCRLHHRTVARDHAASHRQRHPRCPYDQGEPLNESRRSRSSSSPRWAGPRPRWPRSAWCARRASPAWPSKTSTCNWPSARASPLPAGQTVRHLPHHWLRQTAHPPEGNRPGPQVKDRKQRNTPSRQRHQVGIDTWRNVGMAVGGALFKSHPGLIAVIHRHSTRHFAGRRRPGLEQCPGGGPPTRAGQRPAGATPPKRLCSSKAGGSFDYAGDLLKRSPSISSKPEAQARACSCSQSQTG